MAKTRSPGGGPRPDGTPGKNSATPTPHYLDQDEPDPDFVAAHPKMTRHRKPKPIKPIPVGLLVASPAQIRSRSRRRGYMLDEERRALELIYKRGVDPRTGKPLTHEDKSDKTNAIAPVGWKAIEEWDIEELARGRPRDVNGGFRGGIPAWVTQEIHQETIDRLKAGIRASMRVQALRAVEVLADMLESDDEDHRGRPLVPATAKIDVAKFLVEHLVGKPVQPVQNDINVKLQGVLASIMVQPGQLSPTGADGVQRYELAASHRPVDSSGNDLDEMDIVEGQIIHTRATPSQAGRIDQHYKSFVRSTQNDHLTSPLDDRPDHLLEAEIAAETDEDLEWIL